MDLRTRTGALIRSRTKPVAGTSRKIGPRRRRAKGCIEKRASIGKGLADAHRRTDPQSGNTGCGEQWAYVTPFPGKHWKPVMMVAIFLLSDFGAVLHDLKSVRRFTGVIQ
jgi:hypothetical protein